MGYNGNRQDCATGLDRSRRAGSGPAALDSGPAALDSDPATLDSGPATFDSGPAAPESALPNWNLQGDLTSLKRQL
ncbi:unnamed protein product [Cochlearia groenlandica]